MKSAVGLIVVGCLLTSPGLSASQQQQSAATRTRDIYVSVVDSKGEPATGLTARDFSVREDGIAREVVRAETAKDPLDIILLVDDSQAATTAIPHLRDGVTKFAERLQGKAKIGIVTVGERPTSVVESTNDPAAIKKGVGRLFARPGSGAYLLEGISEVTRGFRLRESKRPTIVALTIEAVEFSNLQHEKVVAELLASGATLHVLAIGTPAPNTSDEMRNRNLVLAEGTERTGGRRDQLLSVMSIEERMQQLARELVNQYVVTYGRPETLVPPEKIQVSVNKPGLTARARTRLPQPK
jgi:VWFA-related protein